MPIVVLLVGAGAVIAWAVAKGPHRVQLFANVPREIRFSNGSTPTNMSRLRGMFSEVVDEGGGLYRVTPLVDGLYVAPEGARFV